MEMTLWGLTSTHYALASSRGKPGDETIMQCVDNSQRQTVEIVEHSIAEGIDDHKQPEGERKVLDIKAPNLFP